MLHLIYFTFLFADILTRILEYCGFNSWSVHL